MDNKQKRSRSGIRDHLPLAPQREQNFNWRGNEVSRVEGFTDAVFAFAVTLLVVALEVPHTFEGLMNVVRGFPAFVICFTLLMMFWNAHYRFHRRYGLEGVFTRVMTMAILVLVLFFVYPLKFLFTMLTVQLFGLDLHEAPQLTEPGQARVVYLIYGLGFAGVWGLYAVLYYHALGKREELKLDPLEVVMTRDALGENLVYVFVCALSIALALLTTSTWLPGVIYMVIGPLQALNGWWFGRQVKALVAAG
ncbi:MAG: TMEM175 family protein [Pseudomonadota bacterium]